MSEPNERKSPFELTAEQYEQITSCCVGCGSKVAAMGVGMIVDRDLGEHGVNVVFCSYACHGTYAPVIKRALAVWAYGETEEDSDTLDQVESALDGGLPAGAEVERAVDFLIESAKNRPA